MTLRFAMSLAFLTALAFVTFKSFFDKESAMIGMTILCYGWVATRIVGEGIVSIAWFILRTIVDKNGQSIDPKDYDDEDPYL